MDELDLPQELSFEVVWFDEHMIELEAVVCSDGWRGHVRVYTGEESVATFATAIREFADGIVESAEYTISFNGGSNSIALRFYRSNRPGHLAGHIVLASGGLGDNLRPEQISRLAVEFRVEAWPLTRFAAELDALARARSGSAALPINNRDRR